MSHLSHASSLEEEKINCTLPDTSCLAPCSGGFTENIFVLGTSNKQVRISYAVGCMLDVTECNKGDITEQPKGISGPPPTQEMKHEWGSKEEQSKKQEKDKHSFCKHTAKWPQLKAVVKNWTMGHRNNHISVPVDLVILHRRGWVIAHIITNFSGTNSWCYRFMKCKRTVMSFKEEDITPTLGDNEGRAMFEKRKSLNSNVEYNSSDADFRGLYHQ
jgi:hypothetical protein